MSILKMWVCNADGCKKQAFKRIWLSNCSSPLTGKTYKILIDICKKHYNQEKKAGAKIKNVLVFGSVKMTVVRAKSYPCKKSVDE